ncbi:hypothetical protein [Amycolatopsis kentuckyensis]|uniref:hypothetical protein n=1 Tax=Amycolatopsis kentuckyensis TaxID=218823 RepID=UPI00356163F8
MELVVAAGTAPSSWTDWLSFGFLSGLVLLGMTLTAVRIVRSRQPREKQLARVAAELDGRPAVYFRTMEIGLSIEDLAWVAGSRGYSLIVNRPGRHYKFVYTPHYPGRVA